jgi:hypothetical protein
MKINKNGTSAYVAIAIRGLTRRRRPGRGLLCVWVALCGRRSLRKPLRIDASQQVVATLAVVDRPGFVAGKNQFYEEVFWVGVEAGWTVGQE